MIKWMTKFFKTHFNETETQWTYRGPWAFYLLNIGNMKSIATIAFIITHARTVFIKQYTLCILDEMNLFRRTYVCSHWLDVLISYDISCWLEGHRSDVRTRWCSVRRCLTSLSAFPCRIQGVQAVQGPTRSGDHSELV